RERSRVRVVGAVGGFRGYTLAMAARGADGPVFTVAPDEASARRLASDAAFFLGTAVRDVSDGPVLVVPEIDTSPYADAAADPRAVALRQAALYRLVDPHSERRRRIVASGRPRRRRVVPPGAFLGLCTRWSECAELPREGAIAALGRAGYVRVDVVEDPGTYAVRGGVIDVFVGCARFPTRVEFDDDLIERLRLFDPETQRSLRPVQSVAIHPVRETVATTAASLRARVLALADLALAPSSKSRQIIDNLEQGLEFFGVEALTPIFHDAMAPLWDYLPGETRWLVEEPDALLQVAEDQAQEAEEQHGRAIAGHSVVAPPDQFFVPVPDLARTLRLAPVELSRLFIEPDAAESESSEEHV